MSSLKHHGLGLLMGTALALTCGGPALADDTEIFVGANNTGVKPNILFVIDTSGSMQTQVVTENSPYDPSVSYAGSCVSSRVYWVRDQGSPFLPPSCGTSNYFDSTQLKCKAALDAFPTAGFYAAFRAAQYDAGRTRWQQISSSVKNQPVECRADAGVDGDGVNAANVWATDTRSIKWTSTQANAITWSANNTNRDYVFYSANYLNWYNNPGTFSMKSRLQIVQEVATNVLQSISGVNVGLMRYSSNTFFQCSETSAEGGMVTFAMQDIDAGTARTDIINTVNSYNASGCTPLSETLYEAAQYFRGAPVDYGLNSRTSPGGSLVPSVPASRMPTNQSLYKSPMEFSCQKNFIVYLTDGLPTADTSADAKIQALPDFSTLVGTCDGTGNGRCLDDLAEYLFEADLQPSVNGKQNVVSHWIGFGPEVSGSALLQTAATRGGGRFYSADNTIGLTSVLTSIVNEILRTNTTFTAPSVSVNAFNRTETLNDLYVSVFRPETTYRWPGNVKKYRVRDGQIRDADDQPAVDPASGFFADTARSYWSAATDGPDVVKGGAANRQPPDPGLRKVYTNLDATNPDLTVVGNQFLVTNAAITDARLGTGAPGQPTRDQVIEWARGRDVQDADLDLDEVEARRDLGDPLHAKPAVVIYGGTQATPNIDDAVVYSPTNDGFLHAIDAVTGDELWAFMPEDLLDGVLSLYLNTSVAEKRYALDSEVRVLKYDVDQNGIVEPGEGDKVFLYFGQRRGGSNYYALDVTNKNQPRHLWTRTPTQLPGLGQTWSSPVVTRVNIAGASQNSQKLVLIFAGGYDDTQDNNPYNTDSTGNGVYMVDALTGTLLWRASSSGATLNLPAMAHSMPANISVLDLDSDTFADRFYAGDTGGRVWRFDIFNGSTAANLVTGGVMADLGAASLAAPKPVSATRRFYNAPDVALIKRRGKPSFFNIALGSGFRGHPLDAATQDRFYSIRDYDSFAKFTQAQYNARVAITDADLVDITDSLTPTMADDAKGWRLELRLPGGWVGEKVLAESRTFDNKVFFPTYTPNSGAVACAPAAGSNRAYIVSVFDGSPVVEQDGQAGTTLADRWADLKQGGIAPEVVFLFPARDPAAPLGANQSPLVCLSGAEVLGSCANFTSRFKTIWLESGAN